MRASDGTTATPASASTRARRALRRAVAEVLAPLAPTVPVAAVAPRFRTLGLGRSAGPRPPRPLAEVHPAPSTVPDAAMLARAEAAMARIVAGQLADPADDADLHDGVAALRAAGPAPWVLLVDDASLDDAGRLALREAARRAHPDATLVAHAPGAPTAWPDLPRVGAHPSPLALAAAVAHVYVGAAQLGFEALLVGTPVTCLGRPFYAGAGLTHDLGGGPIAPRRLAQVFADTYLAGARYLDPDDDSPCELERLLDHVELQRTMFARNAGTTVGVGFLYWKRTYVRDYLRAPGNQVTFVGGAAAAARRGLVDDARFLVLGLREGADVRALAAARSVPIWRMEDGFLRSVGLGSNATRPASLVVDRQGIYFDPRTVSELEALLQTADFTADELARAARLRAAIVDGGLSKYNVGAEVDVPVPPGRTVVLVPGQVETDASVRAGCPGIRDNLALLDAARAAAPDAFIIYKPHPDVLSGNRRGKVAQAAAARRCDHIETRATLARCLEVAHEVHTLTSLVGFEALLRGRRVVTHGQPFYAGWGLTIDQAPLARRTRRRSLDDLVAATLIRYPRYVSRSRGHFTTPEAVIAELRREIAGDGDARAVKVSPWRRNLRRLVHVAEELRHDR